MSKAMARWQIATAAILLCWGAVAALASQQSADVKPLTHTHAHNDYEHVHPLFDALDQGFTSVEADIFLVGDQLLVGHSSSSLKPERTLEKLYLEPLRERAKANGGRIYRDGPPFYLLIDVKTAAQPTYKRLHEVLSNYSDLMTTIRDGKVEAKAVTAVVSGNRDKTAMAGQKVRYAGLDGRAADLDGTDPANLMPWISDRWGALFTWKGEGAMPAADRARLQEMVQKAHAQGKLLRFWATPENEAFWGELHSAGVDLINTDKLAELAAFLRKQEKSK
ncbi:MAG TPA: phosphatidylinositol-specific phospholipase C/glycerophosphodiester phosphodiesterase family protein [Gemmataceae bacterium]|nr:phosphatidylinositol-specific phospholipase C/glycerophosphodiester phosphodiesterase family protein [Gemmataceae bacterium]